MKFINIIKSGGVIMVLGLIIFACKKELGKETATEQYSFNNRAIVQVFNASVPNAATDPRRNYVYVNNTPMTGSALAFGSVFPSANGFAITAGINAFLIKDTLVTTTQPQMVFAQNFQAGTNYTIFMYDTFNVVKQKTVETSIVVPADASARVRFANFVYHPTAIPGIDIFSKNRNAFVATNLMVTDVTSFMTYESAKNDTLYVSEAGNPANRLDTLNAFNPVPKRSYTLIFRGRWRTSEVLITAPSTTAPNPRTLSAFPNN